VTVEVEVNAFFCQSAPLQSPARIFPAIRGRQRLGWVDEGNLSRRRGFDLVFRGPPTEMYASDRRLLSREENGYCFRKKGFAGVRAGHFRGVLARFGGDNCFTPCAGCRGIAKERKFPNQWQVVRQWCGDLDFQSKYRRPDNSRDEDEMGLALSSRTQYIAGGKERAQAPVLRAALLEAGPE